MTTVSRAALITGCSTGIGRATAERLADNGWKVYATARRLESIKDLADRGCQVLQLDVCDEASMTAAVEVVENAEGAVGVLVNNAGYGLEGPVEEVPMDEVRRQFETNVFGLARMCQLVLPRMRDQRWGRIVNVSSVGGKLVFPGGGYYHATKHAVEALSDALRFEVRPFGVNVVIIEPGIIKTEFGDTAVNNVKAFTGPESPYAEFGEAVAATIKGGYEGPMSRFSSGPDAVAKVIERAITTSRPRTRYPVTAGAHLVLGLRRIAPDKVFDAVVGSRFKV